MVACNAYEIATENFVNKRCIGIGYSTDILWVWAYIARVGVDELKSRLALGST